MTTDSLRSAAQRVIDLLKSAHAVYIHSRLHPTVEPCQICIAADELGAALAVPQEGEKLEVKCQTCGNPWYANRGFDALCGRCEKRLGDILAAHRKSSECVRGSVPPESAGEPSKALAAEMLGYAYCLLNHVREGADLRQHVGDIDHTCRDMAAAIMALDPNHYRLTSVTEHDRMYAIGALRSGKVRGVTFSSPQPGAGEPGT